MVIRLEPSFADFETLPVFRFRLTVQPVSLVLVQEDLERSDAPASLALLAKLAHICQCRVRSDEQHALTDWRASSHLGDFPVLAFSFWNILWGNTDESVIWQNIIWKSRVPQALTALVAGAGLSVSGLQMQTVFRNPLAGPSVLGISSGASLGVACVVLLSGAMGGVALSRLGYMGEVALSVAAIIGALAVMALIVYVSQKVKGNVTLLIIGVMIGYVASAVIGVLKYFSVEEDITSLISLR